MDVPEHTKFRHIHFSLSPKINGFIGINKDLYDLNENLYDLDIVFFHI